MKIEPLAPFTIPAGLGEAISLYTVTMWFFYFALVYWVVYTIVAVYHWLTYSHSPSVATPAIALHLFVSVVLIGYAVTGLF